MLLFCKECTSKEGEALYLNRYCRVHLHGGHNKVLGQHIHLIAHCVVSAMSCIISSLYCFQFFTKSYCKSFVRSIDLFLTFMFLFKFQRTIFTCMLLVLSISSLVFDNICFLLILGIKILPTFPTPIDAAWNLDGF